MEQDYWDVDDILAESQVGGFRLPCVFAIDVPGLGYLEGAGQSDIQKHTRVELPYWMAHMLAV
ncbi:hypothetical protein Malapachy_0866 [Malassezia pachydermatis]|uniref:DNA replication complex GINS protein PSF3 n=1 Tax=Malassezia pachydermatis TaxID=77020 RepID=A0A0M8MVQ6_9BASI|nr:hypothetical protein Malapachy_0866 [Malassezia pachydermatis]KOS14531.1 hypothetical protein Malapachy_0866 [Malassezia pachydermatis]